MIPASKEEVVGEFRTRGIQEAAMHVIARKGLAGATMQEIAREAGIAKGTIYLYFRSREELLDKTADFARGELLGQLEDVLRVAGTFRERLGALVRTMVEFFHENQEFFRVYVALRLPEDGACRKPSTHHERYLGRLTAFFRDAAARGEIRSADPARAALFFVEGLTAVIKRRILEEPSPTPEQDLDWIVALMLDGLSTHGS